MPKSPRSSRTAFAIVLFTDIVGSTAIASELGDRQWKVLQARHHSLIRTQLREHGGREIDTAGDGFFAAFAEGEAAIRCACAIRDAVMEIGLQVRCGLNVGQVEMNDGKPTGAAVVAAARIMAKAGDGEVLASNLLRELIPGSKIEFADAGVHELKGLEGSWHLFRVVAVDGPPLATAPPAGELTARRTSAASKGADATSLSRSTKILAGATAFLVLVAGIAFWRARGDAGVSTITPNSIGILDLESGEVIETIGLDGRPGSVATSADAVWVTNPDIGIVTQMDPNEQAIRDSIEVGEDPTEIAVGEGALWVVESGGPSVSRISLDTQQVVKTIPVGNGPAGIVVADGSVWVTNRFDGTIQRIDPDRGEVIKTIEVGLDPRGIAFGFGSVWVSLSSSNQVVRVDPKTNSVTQAIGVGDQPGSLALSSDAMWVVNSLDDTVSRIDPESDSVVATIPVGDDPSAVAVVQETVWVANEADGTLSRIDPGQAAARTVAIGSFPQGLAEVNGDLWVSVRGSATSHRGGTLRILSQLSPQTLDPATAYDPWAWAVMHMIGDGLVAFEPIGGTNPRLAPDLATSIPEPTEGGRIYTFKLRSGIPYSNGETVAPADFRRAIERGFRLYPGVYSDFFGGLVGATNCPSDPRGCLSQGIVTDDETGTITFHLLDPDPDFIYKLTLPFAYPVPPTVSEEEQVSTGVPGTGPYVLERPMTPEGVALVRNQLFHVWSPAAQPDGYVDRLEWTFGVQPEAQVEAVAAGEADVAFDFADGYGQLEELFERSAAQVHATPAPLTFFVVLDTHTPPFDEVAVRRALNLAVDRAKVAEILGGGGIALPTCQQLPPNFPGYEPYCPYTKDPGSGTWTAPDMQKAKMLIRRSGTARMRIEFDYTPFLSAAQHRLLADYMVELLKDLGYRASARSIPQDVFGDPRTEMQMAFDAWIPDFPAPSNFITNRFTCDASAVPSAGFCDADIDRAIERAIETQLDAPAAAGVL